MDNYKTIETRLANREPFRGNSLRGIVDTANGTYWVFSYSTTIATYPLNPADNLRAYLGGWITKAGPWVDSKKYSTTTSRHQNLIKRAWGLANV